MNIPRRFLRLAIAAFLGFYVMTSQAQPIPQSKSYRSTINNISFTVFGNNDPYTGTCTADGAFLTLTGTIPDNGVPPYGPMIILRTHPNYNEIIATLIAAKAAGMQVEVYLYQSGGPAALPGCTGGGGGTIPIIGAVYLVG